MRVRMNPLPPAMSAIRGIGERPRRAESIGATITGVAINRPPVEFVYGTLTAEIGRLALEHERARPVWPPNELDLSHACACQSP
jgi:hypothetical protein